MFSLNYSQVIKPVESHSGARGNIFTGPFWEKILILFKWYILAYFIFLADGVPPF